MPVNDGFLSVLCAGCLLNVPLKEGFVMLFCSTVVSSPPVP